MKKTIFIFLGMFLLAFQSCSSQIYMEKTALEKVIAEEQFTFMAQKANPVNQDVMNIANSIPNYSSSRMLDLDYGYTLEMKNKELIATLPYFGRSYGGNTYNTDKQSLRFTSKDYQIQKSLSKKGNYVFRIIPNDVSHIRLIIIEIYKNGKAFVSVDANDRSPISYDGFIMKNEELKK